MATTSVLDTEHVAHRDAEGWLFQVGTEREDFQQCTMSGTKTMDIRPGTRRLIS